MVSTEKMPMKILRKLDIATERNVVKARNQRDDAKYGHPAIHLSYGLDQRNKAEQGDGNAQRFHRSVPNLAGKDSQIRNPVDRGRLGRKDGATTPATYHRPGGLACA